MCVGVLERDAHATAPHTGTLMWHKAFPTINRKRTPLHPGHPWVLCTARGATHSNVHGALVHEAEAGGGVAGSDEDGCEDERRQDESQAPEGAVLGTVVAVVVTMPPHHLMRLRVWLGLRLWVRARVRLGVGMGGVRGRGWGATSPARALARARAHSCTRGLCVSPRAPPALQPGTG